MNYYTIQINSGTSPGPYTIYYNTIGGGNVASIYQTNLLASGLTLTQLQLGVIVYSLQNDVTTIYLVNELCNSVKEFSVNSTNRGYPCICLVINNIVTQEQTTLNFCYNYIDVNGKPQYQSAEGYLLTWNTNGYWEIENYSLGSVIFRSNDFDDSPDSNWYGFGVNSSNYLLIAQIGDCLSKPGSLLSLAKENPSCVGVSNGTIVATATGGSGGWVYSLDGLIYTNTIGIFTSLNGGQYTVYAKDLSGDTLSESISLINTPVNTFSIPITYSVTRLPTIGNMNYYQALVNYDTSVIPNGVTVSFNYEALYNISYIGPGSATFNTSTQYLTKNSLPQSITQTSNTLLSPVLPSSCNPSYSKYDGTDTYTSLIISLVSGDTFTSSIIYGIDTVTNGVNDGSCYTIGSVILNLSLTNLILSCDCCNVDGTTLTISEPPQIYF